jgi:hypothetical protein
MPSSTMMLVPMMSAGIVRQRTQLEHEPVEVSLGRRTGALHLDRVLGREHEERRSAGAPQVATKHRPILEPPPDRPEPRGLDARRTRSNGSATDE